MSQQSMGGSAFEDDAVSAPVEHTAANTDAVDDLLDSIDATLEANAATFVRSFVQKGGQ